MNPFVLVQVDFPEVIECQMRQIRIRKYYGALAIGKYNRRYGSLAIIVIRAAGHANSTIHKIIDDKTEHFARAEGAHKFTFGA